MDPGYEYHSTESQTRFLRHTLAAKDHKLAELNKGHKLEAKRRREVRALVHELHRQRLERVVDSASSRGKPEVRAQEEQSARLQITTLRQQLEEERLQSRMQAQHHAQQRETLEEAVKRAHDEAKALQAERDQLIATVAELRAKLGARETPATASAVPAAPAGSASMQQAPPASSAHAARWAAPVAPQTTPVPATPPAGAAMPAPSSPGQLMQPNLNVDHIRIDRNLPPKKPFVGLVYANGMPEASTGIVHLSDGTQVANAEELARHVLTELSAQSQQ